MKNMYSIKDAKGAFNMPFYKNYHGEAERDFQTLVNDTKGENAVNMYPQDFDLYYLGQYDEITGKIIPLDTPQHMHKAIAFVKSNNMN